MLKETKSDFHVRDVIYNEEDNDDMMKVVAMFDRGGDASELSNVLVLVKMHEIISRTKFSEAFLRQRSF